MEDRDVELKQEKALVTKLESQIRKNAAVSGKLESLERLLNGVTQKLDGSDNRDEELVLTLKEANQAM